MTTRPPAGLQPLATAFALPVGFALLLGIGALAASANGSLRPLAVQLLVALVVACIAAIAESRAILPLALVGWLTATGFSRAPYAELQFRGSPALALACVGAAAVGFVVGAAVRHRLTVRYYLTALGGARNGSRPADAPTGHLVRAPR